MTVSRTAHTRASLPKLDKLCRSDVVVAVFVNRPCNACQNETRVSGNIKSLSVNSCSSRAQMPSSHGRSKIMDCELRGIVCP